MLHSHFKWQELYSVFSVEQEQTDWPSGCPGMKGHPSTLQEQPLRQRKPRQSVTWKSSSRGALQQGQTQMLSSEGRGARRVTHKAKMGTWFKPKTERRRELTNIAGGGNSEQKDCGKLGSKRWGRIAFLSWRKVFTRTATRSEEIKSWFQYITLMSNTLVSLLKLFCL